MSTLSLSPLDKFHKAVPYMKINTKFTLNRYQVGKLVARTGTKSGLSRDQVGGQSSTQLYKTPFSEQVIRYVTIQVTEQVSEHVAPTNHRGHQDLAAEVGSRIKSQFVAQGGGE